jgi:hypothetical protein
MEFNLGQTAASSGLAIPWNAHAIGGRMLPLGPEILKGPKETLMLELMYILLFVGCPIFVVLASWLTKKGRMDSLTEKDLPLADEEGYNAIPKEFRDKLRFMVRYSPVKKTMATRQNYVYMEEQLLYGNIPLTDWIKHDVPLRDGQNLSPQALRRISMLKQYVAPPKGGQQEQPKYTVVAS